MLLITSSLVWPMARDVCYSITISNRLCSFWLLCSSQNLLYYEVILVWLTNEAFQEKQHKGWHGSNLETLFVLGTYCRNMAPIYLVHNMYIKNLLHSAVCSCNRVPNRINFEWVISNYWWKRYKKRPDKPEKLAQCIPIYGTILGQRTRNRANAGPIFLVCRGTFLHYIHDLLCL